MNAGAAFTSSLDTPTLDANRREWVWGLSTPSLELKQKRDWHWHRPTLSRSTKRLLHRCWLSSLLRNHLSLHASNSIVTRLSAESRWRNSM